jgi:hypothetical protein
MLRTPTANDQPELNIWQSTARYISLAPAQEDNDEEDLRTYGDDRNEWWIGLPPTPPVHPARTFYRGGPLRMPAIYPLTCERLTAEDYAYVSSWADTREPRPTFSDSAPHSPPAAPARTRDGSLLEGSDLNVRDKEDRLRDETSPLCTEDLNCKEELETNDYKDEEEELVSEDEVNSPPVDDGNPRVFMIGEISDKEDLETNTTDFEEERLVEVPPALETKDIEELTALAEELTPEQVAVINEETILMPQPTNLDEHLGWDLEQVAEVLRMAQGQETAGQTMPEINFDQEDLTLQKVHQLQKTLRTLERNDDTEGIAILKDTTLAERVTLTIMKERPD